MRAVATTAPGLDAQDDEIQNGTFLGLGTGGQGQSQKRRILQRKVPRSL